MMASAIQAVLPIYFDFRISVAQTKALDKDEKHLAQDSKPDFTLKLLSDQSEASVHTDDLETLQGLLRELRRSHLIAQDDNFYAGGNSHRWVQFYTIADMPMEKDVINSTPMTLEKFKASSKNPLTDYFLQPESDRPTLLDVGHRLDLGTVKEEWVEQELRKRLDSFTENHFMHAFVGTWNVNGRNATEKLDSWLHVDGDTKPDIYVLCFQELDLSAEAYIVFDGSKEEEWTRAIAESLGSGYQKIMSKQLVGLLIVMYASSEHAEHISEFTAQSAGCGIMGVLGNKGGVGIRIKYKDSYLCFVGSHLAADTSQIERRNQDYQEICRRLLFSSATMYDITKSPISNSASAVANKAATIFDSDHTIWAGDLNYRIALPEDQVKKHLKTHNYDTILNEKRRVPAYTDRILWRSKEMTMDGVETLFYRSHMDLCLSDHKPVSAMFKIKVKKLLHDKQAEVHQAIIKELDKYENECISDATISSLSVYFDEVRYLEPKKAFITITNTSQFPAQYRFRSKPQDGRFCKPWVWPNPPVGVVMPGENAKIHLTVIVNNESAPMLNTEKEKMEDILVLHLEHGKDYFLTVSGSYIRTCFGNSLEWLSRLDRPIRLWSPEDDDGDDDDDDDENDLTRNESIALIERQNSLATKSSTGSMKDGIGTVSHRTRDVPDMRKVKNVKSLDSLPAKGPGDPSKTSDKGSKDENALAGNIISKKSSRVNSRRRPKSARQQSLPKDLWRIVDFIYKYGFSVSTMTYIRECLDTGEEFELSRLLDKSALDSTNSGTGDNSLKADGTKEKNKAESSGDAKDVAVPGKEKDSVPAVASATSRGLANVVSPRGSTSDLKPQIARPVSILNGIPPKAANFGLGENRGIHSMAEVLLRFLESLRESVVPTEMYYRALEVANHPQAAYGLLDLMPPVHVNAFVYITSFLRELIIVGGSNNNSGGSNSSKGNEEGNSTNVSGRSSGATGQDGASANNLHTGRGGGDDGAITGPSVGSGSHSSTTTTPRVLQGQIGAPTGGGGVGVSMTSNSSETASIFSNRNKRDDEDYRVSKLAAVFSSVMLRPPPGAERLSEVEALKRKMFLMKFLQEPAEDDSLSGLGQGAPLSSAASSIIAGNTGSGSVTPGAWPNGGAAISGPNTAVPSDRV
ncbi:Type II inositol 1,4,5-trisphosphate 5-phosphatase [Lunasporangiospora selenospora]|uniref:Type II inositol 1,4,5-trisphosphate 5-phosphatase n=1 Tax=Lunasporangiospora selenospora TaxID=979761 RepID=A0A9P6KHY5_9FUNG|nr:Type II inositol 1,4,5-trisphosphate 5-phosphatase [Lunasporangiospora selenospora]